MPASPELIVRGPIRQVGFIVPDPLAAAVEHSRRFGSGPFYTTEKYKGFNHVYRGKKADKDMTITSACGQFGNVMLEFSTQHDDSPSAYRDVFPDCGPGVHHFAFLVDDAKSEIERVHNMGFPLVSSYEIDDSGYAYSFLDTRSAFGVMTEIYERSYLEGFYDFVRQAACDFDGTDPLREVPGDPRDAPKV